MIREKREIFSKNNKSSKCVGFFLFDYNVGKYLIVALCNGELLPTVHLLVFLLRFDLYLQCIPIYLNAIMFSI